MRLINATTFELKDYQESDIPPYAILSHCWAKEEISFQQMQDWVQKDVVFQQMNDFSIQLNPSLVKIKRTCELALRHNINHVWIDTCCIDKTSSAELNEAINSMFKWYDNAVHCIVFLQDLDPSIEIEVGLQNCRWFTRGWTLQELLAPQDVKFYDSSWTFRGTKKDLVATISKVAFIHPSYLVGTIPLRESLSLTHAVVKMSWVSHRTTTKVEDMAYCLLGIFNVHMPLLYGEGLKAFKRLQMEILLNDGDISVLAWKPERPISGTTGVLAKSPSEFSWVRNFNMDFSIFINRKECSFTSGGLRMTSNLLQQPVLDSHHPDSPPYFRYLLDLGFWAWAMTENPTERVWLTWKRLAPGRQDFTFGIFLRKYGESSYCRDFSGTDDGLVVLHTKYLPTICQCPSETLSMHLHRDSLPQTYWTVFFDDAYGNADDSRIMQFGVHFPKLPGLDIVDAGNWGLWDASNRVLLCAYRDISAIVTIKPTDTLYEGMSDIVLLLRPLHIHHKVRIYLLDSKSGISESSLEDGAKINCEDFLELSTITQSLRSKDQKWNINCSVFLEVIPNISARYQILRVDLKLSRVT